MSDARSILQRIVDGGCVVEDMGILRCYFCKRYELDLEVAEHEADCPFGEAERLLKPQDVPTQQQPTTTSSGITLTHPCG